MNEFEKDQRLVRRIMRAQFIGGAVPVAGVAIYHGVVTGAWSGAVMFACGATAALSMLIWLIWMKAEERLKKAMVD
jgi:hypothetical protein